MDGIYLRPDTVLLRTGDQVMTGTLEVAPPSPGMVGVEAGMVVVLDNKFNDVDLDRLVNRTVSAVDADCLLVQSLVTGC